MPLPRPALFALAGLLAGCAAKNDLAEAPVPLGDFALGLNIVVADNAQKSPVSRTATADEWEAAIKSAVDARFGRYEGTRLFNIGLAVEGYALAPPGIPVVAAPKSILIVAASVWDDAEQKKLNEEPKRLIVFESLSGDTVVGSGLTRTKAQQMEALSYNAAKAVEGWFLDNPEWFGLDPELAAAAKAGTAAADPDAAPPADPDAAPAAPAADVVAAPAQDTAAGAVPPPR